MINYEKMRDADVLEKQYKTDSNLRTHISLHQKYSTNKLGYANWIFGQYPLFDGCRILELGCGTGAFWSGRENAIGHNSSLVLSDFSEGMVQIAKDRFLGCGNIHTMQIDIQDIPFEDNRFDFVIANSMLYHVPDLQKAIREVHRVLKPGGVFFAATFGENGLTQYLNDALAEFRPSIQKKGQIAFTLQNGATVLGHRFDQIKRLDYEDSLEVTDGCDLADYVLSMTSMSMLKGSDREDLCLFFESKKKEKGFIPIYKEYGMFVATKS
jgi:ubiquinone/menaquinone biosynthesis C-methylase UbiE